MKGTDNVKVIENALNDVDFKYGDRLRFFHDEADWRVKMDGDVYNTSGHTEDLRDRTSKLILSNFDFEITTSGLKQVSPFTNELGETKITLSGVGCQEGTHKFELSLDPLTKKLKVGGVIGRGYTGTHPFNPYQECEYINIKLLDKYRNIKKGVSIKGPDNVKIIESALNDVDFEYGDSLSIFHNQANWRTKFDGNVYSPDLEKIDLSQSTSKDILNRYNFKITKSGLQEIYKNR